MHLGQNTVTSFVDVDDDVDDPPDECCTLTVRGSSIVRQTP